MARNDKEWVMQASPKSKRNKLSRSSTDRIRPLAQESLNLIHAPQDWQGLTQQIVQEIAQNKLAAAAGMLLQLATESKEFPRQWLLDTAHALESGNWDVLSNDFVHCNFVGPNGFFFITGLYTTRREADEDSQLTAILGRVIPVAGPPIEEMKSLLQQKFGELREAIPVILSYHQLAACGNVGGENGEAFVVANNWQFAGSVRGPSLNNMTEQQRRFLDSGQECIRRIWEPDSAELLLSPLLSRTTGTHYRSLEYQFHDAGHAAGLGLERKVQEKLFLDYWSAAIEESRADGIELELAASTLPLEEAGRVASVNLCVRQALDAHRRGGVNRDADVGASLLNFARLWDSGEITIKGGRLCLRDLSYQSLLRAVKPHREWAMSLTRKELSLDYSMGLFRLYGSVEVHPAIEEMFQGLVVEPCLGVFPELR